MSKISREIASQEINSWLDYKKVNDKKREAFADSIETLIDSICDGSLSLTPEKVLVQELRFPIGEDGKETMAIKSLSFKPRLKIQTIHMHLQGVKNGDADGRVLAYVAALSSTPKDALRGMDTEDFSIGQAIAIFFL
jgi:hypothetical protein